MTGTKGKGAPTPLDGKVAGKLLDLLSTDNAFRRLFKSNPAAALAKVGHKGPIEVAACLQVSRIATKAQIAKARADLQAYLTSALAKSPIQLEAASTEPRRLRK